MTTLLIKPILFTFLSSSSVKTLVIDLLEAYAKSTDNTIDDAAVALVRKTYFLERMHKPGHKEDEHFKEWIKDT